MLKPRRIQFELPSTKTREPVTRPTYVNPVKHLRQQTVGLLILRPKCLLISGEKVTLTRIYYQLTDEIFITDGCLREIQVPVKQFVVEGGGASLQ